MFARFARREPTNAREYESAASGLRRRVAEVITQAFEVYAGSSTAGEDTTTKNADSLPCTLSALGRKAQTYLSAKPSRSCRKVS